jgi:UDP-glucose 4-epimerase
MTSPRGDLTTAVVGAEGFIGATLCRALDRAGAPTVRVVRRRPTNGDVLRAVDLVFYAAGTVTPALAASEPERVDIDRAALAAALDECKRGGRRPTFVLLGSGGTAYRADVPPPYAETSAVGPTGVYGRAKLDQERMLFDAEDAVHPVVLRLSNVYGPGQRAKGGGA